MSLDFQAVRRDWSDGVAFLMREQTVSGVHRVVLPLEFNIKTVEPGESIDPTMVLLPQEAQSLLEALWAIGLRPAEARYPNEHVNALRDHLRDMREIVFRGKAP